MSVDSYTIQDTEKRWWWNDCGECL